MQNLTNTEEAIQMSKEPLEAFLCDAEYERGCAEHLEIGLEPRAHP